MRSEGRDVFKIGSSMKLLAYAMILAGVLASVGTAYDQQRGIAQPITPFSSRTGRKVIAIQAKEPRVYRNLMIYEWLYSGGTLCIGFTLLGFLRRQDELDPLSPRFGGSKELDALDQR